LVLAVGYKTKTVICNNYANLIIMQKMSRTGDDSIFAGGGGGSVGGLRRGVSVGG